MKPKYIQNVLVEFNNGTPYVETFVSSKPITIQRVADYYIATQDFNEDRDGLTFLGVGNDTVDLDDAEKNTVENAD